MFFYPSSFEERERLLLGSRYEKLCQHRTPSPRRGATFNALRGDTGTLAAASKLTLTNSPFAPGAYYLGEHDHPGQHPYYHAGAFYVQEPSAAAPAALLDVQPGLRVADLCAAPGGKACQLAAALNGEGLLLANEIDPERALTLVRNLERMGVVNAVVTSMDTAALADVLPGYFDRILVDAPCSGEAMFRKSLQAIAQYTTSLIERCAEVGSKILDDASVLLAQGGELVYSTCTFSPQENEKQMISFLDRHPEFEIVDLVNLPFGHPGDPNRANFDTRAKCCRTVWPGDGAEGHFMAKLRKNTQTMTDVFPSVSILSEPPKDVTATDLRDTKLSNVNSKTQWDAFVRELFPDLRNRAIQVKDRLILLDPRWPLPCFPTSAVLRAGVAVGYLKVAQRKTRFIPSHALFMAYGTQCQNQEDLTLDDPRTAAWLHGEEIRAVRAQPGWCAVQVDGLPIGGGKVTGGYIKNHYPKGLRNKQI